MGELASDRDFIKFLDRFFIQEVLGIKHIAGSVEVLRNEFPAYRENAERAEKLADFLDQKSDWPPPPVPRALQFVPHLRETASELRRLAKHNVGVSRKNQKGSRQRVFFMRKMAELFSEICQGSLDEQVRILTEIAFPERETTINEVRSARRPTTSKARSARSR